MNLATNAEIARQFGVSRSAVQKWAKQSDFPPLVAGVHGSAVRDLDRVIQWREARDIAYNYERSTN